MQRHEASFILSPSDLASASACDHLVELERRVSVGTLDRPSEEDAQASAIARRGTEHELAYLEALRAKGRQIVEIPSVRPDPASLAAAELLTLNAMKAGAEVIFHASFFHDGWRGQADFLEHVESPLAPSAIGPWAYDVTDTKLARAAKPEAILQLVGYAHHVERLQGVLPSHIHLALGNGERVSFSPADYGALVRRMQADLAQRLAAPPRDSYPHPVAHCAVCSWADRCDAQRREDDHLCLVADIRRNHIEKLAAHGIRTLSALASARPSARAVGIGDSTLSRLHDQARLQKTQRETGKVQYELLPPSPGRGLSLLPEADPGDVYFDMEGDPLVREGGLEYLFGLLSIETGRPKYRAFWAHSLAEEKAALETFIDEIMDRWRRSPAMHIYHYAPYERTALSRLAMKHATRETEVDRILRGGLLLDLYKVVRQGLGVSQESYSIKKLEPLYMGARQAAVKDAGSSIVEYERYLDLRSSGRADRAGGTGASAAEPQSILDAIELYNEEDCVSTWKLHHWLEGERTGLAQKAPLARPPLASADPSESALAREGETHRLVARLSDGVPADPSERSPSDHARWVLAQLLDWHRREAKPEWWSYFSRRDASDDELFDDPESLSGIAYLGPAEVVKQSTVHRYRFDPQQERKILEGKRYVDPHSPTAQTVEIERVDRRAGELAIKIKSSREAPLFTALIPGGPIDTSAHQEALESVAESALATGIDGAGAFRAVRDLLLRLAPNVTDHPRGTPLLADPEDVAARRSIALRLKESYLPVQGPPGAGKTYVGARMIVSLLAAGKLVAITSTSHKAISNLLGEVIAVAENEGVRVRAIQRGDGEPDASLSPVVQANSPKDVEAQVAVGAVNLVAGTSWLMARAALREAFDTVVIDEAGQISLANAVAIGSCAKNMILLGDPQQLSQPSKGVHPEGAGVSALEHVLHGAATIHPEQGLFLGVTRRMHPLVCSFVSEVFYEGRLHAHPTCARHVVGEAPARKGASLGTAGGEDALAGSGLRWLPVEHQGRSTHSPEEIDAVATLVAALLGRPWTDARGTTRTLGLDDILVVSPFNVQVSELREALPLQTRVGTVDKFQGQEAPVVIYSMAASSAENAPRGIEFLYELNRFNVAISRAQGLAVVVCSPALLRPTCRTVEHLRLANALCAFVERATVVPRDATPAVRA